MHNSLYWTFFTECSLKTDEKKIACLTSIVDVEWGHSQHHGLYQISPHFSERHPMKGKSLKKSRSPWKLPVHLNPASLAALDKKIEHNSKRKGAGGGEGGWGVTQDDNAARESRRGTTKAARAEAPREHLRKGRVPRHFGSAQLRNTTVGARARARSGLCIYMHAINTKCSRSRLLRALLPRERLSSRALRDVS